jgi:hypothetical protein
MSSAFLSKYVMLRLHGHEARFETELLALWCHRILESFARFC